MARTSVEKVCLLVQCISQCTILFTYQSPLSAFLLGSTLIAMGSFPYECVHCLPVWSVCTVFLAGHGVFKEVCFVRLLSAVLSESDSPSVASLRGHPSLPLLTL